MKVHLSIKYSLHCRYINSINRKSLTYSLAVNHLTDLSDDELKIMRGYRPRKGPKGGIEFTSDVSVDATPDTWDWRILGMSSRHKVLELLIC